MTLLSSSVQVPVDAAVNNRLQVSQLVGTQKFLTRSEFDQAVTDERSRITNGGGLYRVDEEFKITGETGSAFWFIGADGPSSHARKRSLPGGRSITLAGDANTVTAVTTSGVVPTGGTAGNVQVDVAIGIYYTNNSGTWVAAQLALPIGVPAAFTARALGNADNQQVRTLAANAVATINNGLVPGFGCTFTGPGQLTTAGTATVNDRRSVGAAYTYGVLVNTALDTYDLVGGKA